MLLEERSSTGFGTRDTVHAVDVVDLISSFSNNRVVEKVKHIIHKQHLNLKFTQHNMLQK